MGRENADNALNEKIREQLKSFTALPTKRSRESWFNTQCASRLTLVRERFLLPKGWSTKVLKNGKICYKNDATFETFEASSILPFFHQRLASLRDDPKDRAA